jgi:mannose-6-phosphate isomerase-like protein (cupin superfamily)
MLFLENQLTMLTTTFEKLKHWIQEVPKQVSQFTDEELAQKPQPGKWSKKEILGHLVDSGINNWQRFINAQIADEHFIIRPYSQDNSVHLNNYQNQPINQVLSLWGNVNQQILTVIEQIPTEKLSMTVVLPNSTSQNLKWLIEDYVIHLEHHLNQLFPLESVAKYTLPKNWKITVDDALNQLKKEPIEKYFTTLLKDKKIYVEIYAPHKIDLQTPHDQDEIYIIISGSGTFLNDKENVTFKENDVLFVPKGVEHRFVNFTDDFKTWVIFY